VTWGDARRAWQGRDLKGRCRRAVGPRPVNDQPRACAQRRMLGAALPGHHGACVGLRARRPTVQSRGALRHDPARVSAHRPGAAAPVPPSWAAQEPDPGHDQHRRASCRGRGSGGARPLGGRPDHRQAQPLSDRHVGRAHDRPTSTSTSDARTRPGNAPPTRTPTGCSELINKEADGLTDSFATRGASDAVTRLTSERMDMSIANLSIGETRAAGVRAMWLRPAGCAMYPRTDGHTSRTAYRRAARSSATCAQGRCGAAIGLSVGAKPPRCRSCCGQACSVSSCRMAHRAIRDRDGRSTHSLRARCGVGAGQPGCIWSSIARP
jgi:hypothetical protein